MHSSYAFLALDLANERAAEADAQRLALLAHRGEARPGLLRRAVARLALAVARAADADAAARTPVTTH